MGGKASRQFPTIFCAFISGKVLALVQGYGHRIDRVGIYVYDRRVPLRRLDGRITLTVLGANWTLLGRNLTEFAYTEIERNLSPPREWMLSVTRSWR